MEYSQLLDLKFRFVFLLTSENISFATTFTHVFDFSFTVEDNQQQVEFLNSMFIHNNAGTNYAANEHDRR